MIHSLTVRLLATMILPAVAIALVLGAGGAIMIQGIVENVNDRMLTSSARSIADTLAMEDGEVTLDLPQSAFGMLENDERDNVYYSVFVGQELITGYADLPRINPGIDNVEGMRFTYFDYRGTRIRMLSVARRVPRVEQPVIVQVAETLDARHALRNKLLLGLVVLEAVLIGAVVLLLPLAVRWGLRPLAKVRREIDGRLPTDFTPLGLAEVPTELRGYFTAFNGLLLRLRESMENMRRFTADASHQLRTPLSILRAHLQVVRREGLNSSDGRSSLDDIEAATGRLHRLLVQLLALARAEEEPDDISVLAAPVDVRELARLVAEEYVPAALRARIDIQFQSGNRPASTTTVDTLAREMIANLVDNAIRYNRPGGTVIVNVATTDEAIIVAVEDDGPGIPEAERTEVFKRFRRLNRDRKREGSGLGLAIVHALARRMGACLALSESRSGGVRAEIWFPVGGQAGESRSL